MRIGLQITGGTVVWLAGDPGVPEDEFNSASQVEINGSAVTKTTLKLRAESRKVSDRGNVGEQVTFSTVRAFPTVAAQQLWSLDHARTQPRAGTLVFEITTGGSTSYRYLPNCVLQPPRRVPMGVSVMVTYQAEGGMITDVNPIP